MRLNYIKNRNFDACTDYPSNVRITRFVQYIYLHHQSTHSVVCFIFKHNINHSLIVLFGKHFLQRIWIYLLLVYVFYYVFCSNIIIYLVHLFIYFQNHTEQSIWWFSGEPLILREATLIPREAQLILWGNGQEGVYDSDKIIESFKTCYVSSSKDAFISCKNYPTT